ncbi:MAG: hypothetical protein EZS28_023419 [Streblomastix strix]|uniref:JAB1/MPN/MOV34 metalloenzyme domain-containing protein n=1 Tax=Streblomastix strix TaxID=222440 RepID=A0A5J4VF89_9EUKA|nr:MAG: hypothetical protein EZS28_023419 [Streblomastix strix]
MKLLSLVPLQILNAHVRTTDATIPFTFGALLGSEQTGSIEILASYPVPHFDDTTEKKTELYFQQTLSNHQAVKKNETLQGWYVVGDGLSIEMFIKLDNFFSGFAKKNIIFLSVEIGDTKIPFKLNARLTNYQQEKSAVNQTKDNQSTEVQQSLEQILNILPEIDVEIVTQSLEEKVALSAVSLAAVTDKGLVAVGQKTSVQHALQRLAELVELCSTYCDMSVTYLEGEKTKKEGKKDKRIPSDFKPNQAFGHALINALKSIPNVATQRTTQPNADSFTESELFSLMLTDQLQDALMASYLADLAKTACQASVALAK